MPILPTFLRTPNSQKSVPIIVLYIKSTYTDFRDFVPVDAELIDILGPAEAIDMRPRLPLHVQQAALNARVPDDSAQAAEARVLVDLAIHLS